MNQMFWILKTGYPDRKLPAAVVIEAEYLYEITSYLLHHKDGLKADLEARLARTAWMMTGDERRDDIKQFGVNAAINREARDLLKNAIRCEVVVLLMEGLSMTTT